MSGAQVVLASSNPGKLREFSAILGEAGIDMVPQTSLGVAEAAEPYETFIENALAKARHASRLTGMPALADDSGLCVHALGGAPGVHSARFASLTGGPKSDSANNRHLVAQLAGQPDRRACYVAVLVYLRRHDDPRPMVVEGAWQGEILDQPRGNYGFGYDAHFYLPDMGMTVAELPPDRKNALSHRAQALHKLLAALRGEFE
jgi:XTP/dITP diphosphohydrolase